MKKLIAGLLCLLVLFTLCACGFHYEDAYEPVEPESGSQRNTYSSSYSSGAKAAAGAPYVLSDSAAPMAAAEYGDYDVGLAMGGDYEEAAQTSGGGSAGSGEDVPAEDPEKIIYSSDVTVETTEFETALQSVNALVERYGGWIESSSINGANFYDIARGRTNTRSANYVLRIPSSRFNELMGSLSEIGNIPYTHIYTENVTAQYYDVQARLTALQTQETRLLEMMKLAETVDDVITIEEHLTELRYQIESLQSKLNNWDRRVSYSSVTLKLSEVKEYTPETPVKISYGERLARAFRSGLAGVSSFFRGFLLWFVEALPTLVLLAVLAVAVIPLLRRVYRKLKARAAEKRAAKAAKREELFAEKKK